jgi:hypothetical protein
MNANEPPMPEAEARLAAFLTAQPGRDPSPDDLWQRLAPHLSAPSAPGERDIMEHPLPDTTSSSASAAPACRPPHRPRIPAWRAIPVAAAMLIIALVATLFATLHGRQTASVPANGTPGTHPTSTLAPTTTGTGVPPGTAPQDGLSGVSLSSPSDGWAVGQHDDEKLDTSQINQRPLLYHLVNGTWTPVALPASIPGDIGLRAVSFDAPNDGWAVGNHGFLHYDGTAWGYIPNPLGAQFSAVQMLAPNVGWAVGTLFIPNSSRGVIVFYDGTRWTQQPIPALNGAVSMSDLSMLSPQDGWAVGTSTNTMATSLNGVSTAIILRWHNGRWGIQDSIPNVILNSIAMTSLADGWAVGGDQYSRPLIYHYQGSSWAPIPIASYPVDGGFGLVRMASPTDGWITGSTTSTQDAQKSLTLLHYDGTAWRQVPTPDVGAGRIHASVVSFAISGSTVWAVGSDFWAPADGVIKGNTFVPKLTPLIMQYVNGAWVVVQG